MKTGFTAEQSMIDRQNTHVLQKYYIYLVNNTFQAMVNYKIDI